MGYRTENQTAHLQPERVRVCETTLQTPRSVKKEGEEVLQALEQSPQHSPTCRSAALGSPRHLPAPPRPRCLPLAPGSPSAQHQAALAAGSDTAWHRCASDTDPTDPTGTTTPLRAFPNTHRSIVQPCSPSPSVQPQPGNRSALPLAHSSPSTSNHPFTGRGRHHQPHCPHLGLQPRPTAGAQHKQGPSPNAHSASPPPLGSITAQCKGRANTARRAKETASVYSVMHVPSPGSESAPGLRAPSAPPAPGTPQQSFPELRLSVQWATDSRSVGSWSDGLLGRGGGCQK